MTKTAHAETGEAGGASDPRTRLRRARRRLVALAILVVALGGTLGAVELTSGSGPPPLPPVPHFSLPRLGGGAPISYPSAPYKSRPVVLVFYASWCTACQPELPKVAKAVSELQAAGTPVTFLGVDGNDPPAAGLAFARKDKVTFPSVSDENETLANAFGLPGLPDTVFISRAGKVVHINVGVISTATLRHWVHAIATERAGLG